MIREDRPDSAYYFWVGTVGSLRRERKISLLKSGYLFEKPFLLSSPQRDLFFLNPNVASTLYTVFNWR